MLVMVSAVLLLSGCAADEVVADPAARGLLDEQNGQILMPLSEYDLTDSEQNLSLMNRALFIYIDQCMTKFGFSYPAGQIDSDAEQVIDDRPYGLWWEPGVRKYGFGRPVNEADVASDAARTAGGDSWIEAEAACAAEASSDPELSKITPTNEVLNGTIVGTIRTDAYRLASADPGWQAARERWWSCLRKEGLEPKTGATDWGTKISSGADSEEGFRAALVQAKCNNETRLTQTLADLEASYQQPMIEKNQAALNEWKQDKQTRLEAARDYIARNG